MNSAKYEKLVNDKQNAISDLKAANRKMRLEKYKLFDEIQGPQSSEFPFNKYQFGKLIYYKKVYDDVSDIELDYLDSLILSPDGSELIETNAISFNAINFIGYLWITIGILAGLSLFNISYLLGFGIITGGIIVGVAFLAMGHIIRQLNIIINNLKKNQ